MNTIILLGVSAIFSLTVLLISALYVSHVCAPSRKFKDKDSKGTVGCINLTVEILFLIELGALMVGMHKQNMAIILAVPALAVIEAIICKIAIKRYLRDPQQPFF